MMFDTNATITGQASLDALWLKTQVITNNLSNIDTPGFKASRVTFEDALNTAKLKRETIDGKAVAEAEHTAARRETIDGVSISGGKGDIANRFSANVYTDPATSVRQDGNNVSLEYEQTELWKAYAQYSYLLDRVSGHYKNISAAVAGMRT
jgi:flagellar basal-body rod protein FlgB